MHHSITILKPEGAFWCLYAPFRFCLGQVVIPETNYSSDNIDTVLMAFSQDLGRIIAADKKAQLSGHGRIGPVVDHSAFLISITSALSSVRLTRSIKWSILLPVTPPVRYMALTSTRLVRLPFKDIHILPPASSLGFLRRRSRLAGFRVGVGVGVGSGVGLASVWALVSVLLLVWALVSASAWESRAPGFRACPPGQVFRPTRMNLLPPR